MMELLTLMLLVSSLFIVFKFLLKPGSSSQLLNRIPGPRRLPVIGNLHLLAGKSPPHRVFRDLAGEYGPLMRLQMGAVPFLIVSSVEVAGEVLKTNDITFANRPSVVVSPTITYNHANIAGAPYGEYWRQLRKICTVELLSARRVRSFRRIREEVNSGLARWVAKNEGSPADLSERVYQSAFDVTSRAAIGEETEEKEATKSAFKEALKMVSGLFVADFYPSNSLLPVITGVSFKLRRVFRRTDRTLRRIIDGHREAGAGKRSEDLVDVLLKYQEDGGEVLLTDDNIKAVILDIFLAGGDTSASVVDWAMSEMMKNPATLKRAQEEVRRVLDAEGYVDEEKFQDLKYLKLVIKETLRMHPPFPLLIPHVNNERCEINGYEIPAKTKLVINAWALGRDPKYWNDAEKFMPERFEGENSATDFKGNNLEYIPFGSGRRICPGMWFGLANVEFSLAVLLYHFDWKMGEDGEEMNMDEELSSSLKRKHSLLLIPTLKRPFN